MATKKHRVSKGDAKVKRVDNVEMVLRAYEVARRAASAKPPTRKELAAEYGITPRAVNNLISFMKQIGINVVTAARSYDGKPAYTLRASDFLQLDMSVSEAVASVHLQQAVLGTPLVGDDRAAADSVHQITARLRDQVRSKLDAL